ncbi:hypothetical protein Tco_0281719 [Tanacetum coccineum]
MRTQACYEHPTGDLSRPPPPTLLIALPPLVPREAPSQLAPLLALLISSNMEYNPSNLVFTEYITSKFHNHLEIDWNTKNALWVYWMRGDDEVVLSDKEVSDLKDKYNNDEHEIVEIFRIETNVFDYETPLCTRFNEFNYLPKVDTELFTHDIERTKTYEDYENELNK